MLTRIFELPLTVAAPGTNIESFRGSFGTFGFFKRFKNMADFRQCDFPQAKVQSFAGS